jgi:DNA polymerase elongation subunit (family B)
MDSVFFSAVPLLNHRFPLNWQVKPKTEIIKLVDDIAGETQDYLNSFYDLMAIKLFNLPKLRFQIKKEFISMSGLWISKKHYAQLIIAENGVMKETPELDVKGLDVKRSSFPKAFQEIMKQVLIDILYGVDEDTITGKINEFKATMKEFPIADTAKNTSVQEMSKYIMKGRQPFTMMKGTPAHVKAAIRYNDCLKYFNAAYRYEPMKDGEKLKWAYLRTNPLGMDSLAFKGEDDPKEIMDFINLYIDRTRIFESELHEKLQAFYDAIGWEDCLSQKASASRFFEF